MTLVPRKVYVLDHAYEHANGCELTKLIGIYESEERARKAIARLSSQPGFRDYPGGFHVSTCELDRDNWTEGFISWDEASKPR